MLFIPVLFIFVIVPYCLNEKKKLYATFWNLDKSYIIILRFHDFPRYAYVGFFLSDEP